MITVSIDELEVGNVTAQDITAPNGMVILQAGTELSESHISRMKKIGIKEACIHQPGISLDDLKAEQLEVINRKFKGYDGDAFMMEIKEIILKSV